MTPEQKLQMAISLLEEYYKDRLCEARGMSLEAHLVRMHLLEIKKIINQLNNVDNGFRYLCSETLSQRRK